MTQMMFLEKRVCEALAGLLARKSGSASADAAVAGRSSALPFSRLLSDRFINDGDLSVDAPGPFQAGVAHLVAWCVHGCLQSIMTIRDKLLAEFPEPVDKLARHLRRPLEGFTHGRPIRRAATAVAPEGRCA